MTLPVALITLLLLALVVLVLSAPLRSRGEGTADGADRQRAADATIAHDELEAAREAKYREIRDAELDYRTGKLSREDYDTVDGDLRAEAIEILNRLDGAGGEATATADELNGAPR